MTTTTFQVKQGRLPGLPRVLLGPFASPPRAHDVPSSSILHSRLNFLASSSICLSIANDLSLSSLGAPLWTDSDLDDEQPIGPSVRACGDAGRVQAPNKEAGMGGRGRGRAAEGDGWCCRSRVGRGRAGDAGGGRWGCLLQVPLAQRLGIDVSGSG